MKKITVFVAGVLMLGFATASCGQSPATPNDQDTPGEEEKPPVVSHANPKPVPAPVDSEFGPVLGTPIQRKSPTPGRYLAKLDFSQRKFRTREIVSSHQIYGHTEISLHPDGRASACFAAKHLAHYSASKLVPGSHGDTTRDTTNMWILGAMGRWIQSGDAISVSFDLSRRGSCDISDRAQMEETAIDMTCVTVLANDKLPVDTLLCKGGSTPGIQDDVSFAPGDTPRAGPFSLQRDVSRRLAIPIQEDQWFIAGTAPGILITSRDGRNNPAPEVIFTPASITFNENAYSETREQKQRRLEKERRQEEANQPPPVKLPDL